MRFEILTDENAILMSKKLVYKTYTEEMSWEPPDDNPSDFRIEIDANGDKYLDDKFSNNSTYIAMFDESHMVATARVIKQKDSPLEVTLYRTLEEPLNLGSSLAEINRVAVKKEYMTSNALLLLFSYAIKFCEQGKVNYLLTTVAFPNPGNFFIGTGFEKSGDEFRYSKNDPAPVNIVFFDLEDRLKMQKAFNLIGDIINKVG